LDKKLKNLFPPLGFPLDPFTSNTSDDSGCLWICLEIVDPFAFAVGVCGLACRGINVSQARHVSLLFVGLGSAGSGRCDLVSAQLAPSGSGTTAATSSSASTSPERHGDHVGSAALLVIRGIRVLVIDVVVFFCWCRGIAVAGNSPPTSSSAAVWMLAMEIISLGFRFRVLYSHSSLCRSKPPLYNPPMKANIVVVSSTFSQEFL
jgi:hypothetical protein